MTTRSYRAYPYDIGEIKSGPVTKLRPGEPINLEWAFQFTTVKGLSTKYFHGYNVSGGVITEIMHPDDSEDRFYKVSIEGRVGVIQATDYYPYEVGDWVSVVFVKNNDDIDPSREIDDWYAAGIFIVPFFTW